MYQNKEYQHPEYDLTVVDRYLGQPYTANEYVVIPHTHTGYGASAIEIANDRVIESDSNLIGRLNLDTIGDPFGHQWVAIIDDYTTEQFEELEELIQGLNDYPLLDESVYSEVDMELQEEYVKDALPYESEIEPHEFIAAGHELGIYVEPDSDTYFISEDDFATVLEHAEGVKSQLVTA